MFSRDIIKSAIIGWVIFFSLFFIGVGLGTAFLINWLFL